MYHTCKMFILPQGAKCFSILFLIVIPSEAKVFILHRLGTHHVVALRQDEAGSQGPALVARTGWLDLKGPPMRAENTKSIHSCYGSNMIA